MTKPKILYWGAHLNRNLGGPSLLASTCRTIRKYMPDAEFGMFSLYPEADSVIAERYNVRITGYRIRELYAAFLISLAEAFIRKLGIRVALFAKNKIIGEYRNADIIIDITGIAFTDYFPGIRSYARQGIQILIGALLGKPVVKFTQDMGPFENRANRHIARICLNRLGFILARSEKTKSYLGEIGIKRPVYVRPDTAFVLEPADEETVRDIFKREGLVGKPLIGIAASRQVDKRISEKEKKVKESQNSYTEVMAQLADYIIEKTGAVAVFVPNEIAMVEGGYDDIYVSRKIYEKIRNKHMVRIMAGRYDAPELKGIVGKCDFVVTSRYHSTVAALSMRVPCLVVGWGFKYEQVMKLAGQEGYVCNYEGLNFQTVREKMDSLMENRDAVKSLLDEKIPVIEDAVMSSGGLVKELLKDFYGG
jgi:polysaccharide pyruvyl transferase WcaK-like protein